MDVTEVVQLQAQKLSLGGKVPEVYVGQEIHQGAELASQPALHFEVLVAELLSANETAYLAEYSIERTWDHRRMNSA